MRLRFPLDGSKRVTLGFRIVFSFKDELGAVKNLFTVLFSINPLCLSLFSSCIKLFRAIDSVSPLGKISLILPR